MISKSTATKWLFLILVFFTGIGLGSLLWERISLPFQNPWQVIGPLTQIKFNPTNNLIRFAVMVFLPILLLCGIYFLRFGRFRDLCFPQTSLTPRSVFLLHHSKIGGNILISILFMFSILVALNVPTHHSTLYLDTFHEGESLGTAVSFQDGQVPYRDFLFVHGVYQDPLRSVVAFDLLGKSISSVKIVESLTKIIAFVLLTLFVLKIFKRNYLYCFLTILILALFYLNHFRIPQQIGLMPRDVTLFAFLLTIPFLGDFIAEKKGDRRKFLVVIFLFSFLPLASFAYSIDRGFYLFSTYLIVSPLIYLIFFRKSFLKIYYLIASLAGLLSALLVLGIALRGAFWDFFKFSFLEMPQFKELMDGFIYDISNWQFLGMIILLAACVYWLSYKFLQEMLLNQNKLYLALKGFLEKYLIELSLGIVSLFFFRSALGRADQEHLVYSSFPAYLLLTYIFIKYYLAYLIHRFNLRRIFVGLIVFAVIVVSMAGVNWIRKSNLVTENFPTLDDSWFIPGEYKETVSFLKNNLGPEEKFFTMTNEASWYYFLDQPSPTRFPVVWFAGTTFYQKEIVAGLEENNVKYILYKNVSGANIIDKITNEDRLPLLVDYVRQNYQPFKVIDGNEIWIKK